MRRQSYRQRDAFSKKTGEQVAKPAKPRSFERIRIDHSGQLTARFRRRVSAAENQRFALERRAFPETVINGTILERIVAKQVSDRKYAWQDQYDIALPGGLSARLDIAVFGTGIGQAGMPLALEANGLVWHVDREHDALRALQLAALGVVTIRLWEPDLINEEERMHRVIDDALRGIERPPPTDMPAPIRFF